MQGERGEGDGEGSMGKGVGEMGKGSRAHVAQTVVMLIRISCKKAVRVGKAHVDP